MNRRQLLGSVILGILSLWGWRALAFLGETFPDFLAPQRECSAKVAPFFPNEWLPIVLGGLFLIPAILVSLAAMAPLQEKPKAKPLVVLFLGVSAVFLVVPIVVSMILGTSGIFRLVSSVFAGRTLINGTLLVCAELWVLIGIVPSSYLLKNALQQLIAGHVSFKSSLLVTTVAVIAMILLARIAVIPGIFIPLGSCI